MKLISKRLHERLKASANRTKARHADNLLSQKVAVSVRILKEIGVPVSQEAADALAKVDSKNLTKGETADAVTVVKLSHYLQGLAAYQPDEIDQESEVVSE